MLGKSTTYGRRKRPEVLSVRSKSNILSIKPRSLNEDSKNEDWLNSLGVSLTRNDDSFSVPEIVSEETPVSDDPLKNHIISESSLKIMKYSLHNIGTSLINKSQSHQGRPSATCKSRLSDIRPARLSINPTDNELEELLKLCGSKKMKRFNQWLDELEPVSILKIGESTFSEVFRLDFEKSFPLPSNLSSITASEGKQVALKIMPLLSPLNINSHPQESIGSLDNFHTPEPIEMEHLLREIKALKSLNKLSEERKYAVPSGFTGFNRLLDCVLVNGEYPLALTAAWDSFKNQSENERPDFYRDHSMHVILIMEFGGTDLEAYKGIKTNLQIQSIMMQLLAATSLAEEKMEFEHRDLHLGNILVRETHRESLRLENYMTIPTAGITCSIIDCSLSRFLDNGGSVISRDLKKDGWLFTGSTDVSLQYQIYRDMQVITDDNWDAYAPRTNVLWIAYIIDELLRMHQKILKKDDPKAFQKLSLKASIIRDAENSSSALKKIQ